ncbi:MAG TPA: hypothetical protein VFH57_05410 [Gammaproteobacteria bacterium]|nr:hypothetical protein [Gammaproteobacteria bacterium]
MNKAGKQYMAEMLLSMGVLYPGALFLANYLHQTFNPTLPWRAVLAFLPVLPGIWALTAVFRFVRKLDELQRRIQFEAAVFSLVVTILFTFTYGFMQDFLQLPTFPLYWVTTLMIVAWGIGNGIASRKYA